jgi:hypothetical protein
VSDKVRVCPLPTTAFLRAYRERGAYTDCLSLDVAGAVSLGDYVTTFYTSAAFRLERVILSLLLGMRSTDAQAAALGEGTTDRFAAWHVEQRSAEQILLCDHQSRTRSWLMVAPIEGGSAGAGTRLYFGTAVTQVDKSRGGRAVARFVFRALLWFHKLYARVLLWGAGRRLG